MKIKRLSLQQWMKECEISEYKDKVSIVFWKEGIYHIHHKRHVYTWFEVCRDGVWYAIRYSTIQFKFELDILHTENYGDDVLQSLVILDRTGLITRKQRKFLYNMIHQRDIKNIRRDTHLNFMRYMRKGVI